MFISLLTGCSQDTPSLMQNYHQRVANVLELDAYPIEPYTPPPAPSARSLRLELPPIKISLLEFLKLWRCDLNRVLAERNSPLGKVAPPSQQLHNTRDMLISGEPCVATLRETDPDLAIELDKALQQRREQRMLSWWNAWLGSKEWQQFSRSGAEPLMWPAEQSEAARLSCMQALDFALLQGKRWLQQNYAYDANLMEHHQQQLALSELLGSWRNSQLLLTQISRNTAALLQQRAQQQPLCPQGRPTPRANILKNVFNKFYAGRFQPYLALVHRSGEQILQRLDTFFQLAPAPADFQAWLMQLKSEREQLDQAHRQHVEAWQATLKSCGLMPGNPL